MAEYVFPYDSVRDFLQSHPLLALARVSPMRVYGALEKIVDAALTPSAGAAPAAAPADPVVCRLCGESDYEVNPREATLVCRRCGCAQSYVLSTNCFYYNEQEHRSAVCEDDAATAWQLRREVEHWSQIPDTFAFMTGSELDCAVRHASVAVRYGLVERAVAGLLAHKVLSTLDMYEIARRARTGAPFDVMGRFEPTTARACTVAGRSSATRTRLADAWDAKKRKRPG